MSKKDKKMMPKDSSELNDENAGAVSGGFKMPKLHIGFENGEFKAGVDMPKSSGNGVTDKLKSDFGYYKDLLKKK
ncbi:MAG: hypothetical protein RUMPE_00252 [Eubacteriales bacterium SKADARSKE-1]|nr:hypothetical protein [Eubacteriales bacterium SKADARSKE-1]